MVAAISSCQLAFQCQHVWFMPYLIHDALKEKEQTRFLHFWRLFSYKEIVLQFQIMYIWIVLLQICINHSHTRTQWTCGLWDVKQMIFVHDYLKLMDKIWPLSALHLHHRRTSTNDRSKQVTHCLQLWTWILLSILIHSNSIQLNIWKQFNKLISNKNDSYICCSYFV